MHVGSSGEVAGIDSAPEMVAVVGRTAARKGADVSFRKEALRIFLFRIIIFQ
jgi:hypothetical protein